MLAAGSGAQLAVPVGLAVYFLAVRRDRLGGALCLAWALGKPARERPFVDTIEPRGSLLTPP